MSIDPKTTALLLIEFQNDFVTEGGVMHAAVKPVMESTHMLQHSVHLAKAAREAGVTVLHAPIAFAEGYREITSSPYGVLKNIVGARAFVKDSWGAQIAEPMAPQAEDIVIEGKRGLDVFASTNLDFILRSRGIKTLAVAGFLTNCCVESTVRSGYERGFEMVAVRDCTATLSAEEQQFTFEKNLPMFAHIMSHVELLGRLGVN